MVRRIACRSPWSALGDLVCTSLISAHGALLAAGQVGGCSFRTLVYIEVARTTLGSARLAFSRGVIGVRVSIVGASLARLPVKDLSFLTCAHQKRATSAGRRTTFAFSAVAALVESLVAGLAAVVGERAALVYDLLASSARTFASVTDPGLNILEGAGGASCTYGVRLDGASF